MRSFVSIVAIMTALTVASPTAKPVAVPVPVTNELTTPNPATTAEIEKAIVFAIQASCDVFKCVSVVAAAPCILGAIGKGALGAAEIIGCVSDGRDALCSCAGCIDALGDFLTENKICPE